MSANGWLQILLFLGVVAAMTPLAGRYMARVFSHGRTWLDPVLEPLERMLYRVCRIDPAREMRWTEYATALAGVQCGLDAGPVRVATAARLAAAQPAGFGAVSTHSSFNTAASFTSNTNWQGVRGRVHDELSHPDGGARISQLRVRRGRHRAGDRVHSRDRAAGTGHDRQFLGRHDARPAVDSAARRASWPRCCSSRRVWCRTSSHTTP